MKDTNNYYIAEKDIKSFDTIEEHSNKELHEYIAPDPDKKEIYIELSDELMKDGIVFQFFFMDTRKKPKLLVLILSEYYDGKKFVFFPVEDWNRFINRVRRQLLQKHIRIT